MATVAAGTLPGVVASASTGSFAPSVVDEATVERAQTGISVFVIDNVMDIETGITAPCPMMTVDQFGWFMGQQGLSPNLTGWAVDLFYYDDVGEGAPGLSCGVDPEAHLDQIDTGAPHGGYLEAMTLPATTTFAQVLGVVDRATSIGPGAPEIGGEIGGVCYTGQLAACFMMWHRSGLVLTTILSGPAAEVTQERTIALLTSMVPTIVAGLAAYADTPTPGSPTTIAAAPATAAAATTAATPVATTAVMTPATIAAASTTPLPSVPPSTLPPSTVPVLTAPAPAPPVSTANETPTTAAAAPTTASAAGSLDLDLAGARATLAEFLIANPVGTDVVTAPGAALVCPGSGLEEIGQAMTAVGLVPTLTGFRVTVEQSGIAPGLRTVTCGGDVIQALVDSIDATAPSHTPLLTIYDIDGIATLEQVLAERPGLTLLQGDVPTIGGDIYGASCDLTTGSGTFCVRVWHRDGFVVMIEVAGWAQPGFDQVATQLITTLVPGVVDDLATRANWPPVAGLR